MKNGHSPGTDRHGRSGTGTETGTAALKTMSAQPAMKRVWLLLGPAHGAEYSVPDGLKRLVVPMQSKLTTGGDQSQPNGVCSVSYRANGLTASDGAEIWTPER